VYNSKLQNQIPASVREEQQQQQQQSLESALGDIEGNNGNHLQGGITVEFEKKNTLTDDSVVFESEPFFIVARKKKKNDEFFSLPQ
jgi:hypothetical protein